jgi:translation initiation factor IF-3
MASIKPNTKKRSYLLPAGCKDLADVLNGKSVKSAPAFCPRVNGKIKAHSVQVIDDHSKMLGVMRLAEALDLAKSQGLDLVELEPRADFPVCQLIDFGKFRYLQARGTRPKTGA